MINLSSDTWCHDLDSNHALSQKHVYGVTATPAFSAPSLVWAFVACSYFIYIKLTGVITESLWHKNPTFKWSNQHIFTRHQQAIETIQQTHNLSFDHDSLLRACLQANIKWTPSSPLKYDYSQHIWNGMMTFNIATGTSSIKHSGVQSKGWLHFVCIKNIWCLLMRFCQMIICWRKGELRHL
jgi:hypothetical protein